MMYDGVLITLLSTIMLVVLIALVRPQKGEILFAIEHTKAVSNPAYQPGWTDDVIFKYSDAMKKLYAAKDPKTQKCFVQPIYVKCLATDLGSLAAVKEIATYVPYNPMYYTDAARVEMFGLGARKYMSLCAGTQGSWSSEFRDQMTRDIRQRVPSEVTDYQIECAVKNIEAKYSPKQIKEMIPVDLNCKPEFVPKQIQDEVASCVAISQPPVV